VCGDRAQRQYSRREALFFSTRVVRTCSVPGTSMRSCRRRIGSLHQLQVAALGGQAQRGWKRSASLSPEITGHHWNTRKL
jgi:hypothetical protein